MDNIKVIELSEEEIARISIATDIAAAHVIASLASLTPIEKAYLLAS